MKVIFILKKMRKKRVIALMVLSLLAFIPDKNIEETEFPLYRVVIDPGHGGVFLENKKKHGDKYDLVTAQYIDYYAEGASYKGIYENKIVYNIAVKVMDLLSLCSKDGDFEKFKTVLKKYTDSSIAKIYIETIISRGRSVDDDKIKKGGDPNAEYRLYDYPAPDGEMLKGRISQINEFKPHLVVSLHLAKTAPPGYLGMNGIIVPPYNVLKKGLLRLQTGDGYSPVNDYNVLNSWFRESNRLPSKYYWLKDSSQYFTGYGLKKNLKPDLNDFNGYKYNMVKWIYRDKQFWDMEAEKHPDNTRYSADYNTIKEDGPFRDRERSVYEEYRRGTGFKDFGGDNYYATYEIIKYVLLSLKESGASRKDKIPGRPFVSTWSLPMLINAISAYIELGYLDRKWDRDILLHRQDAIAEGVAVGIYSLLTGIEVKGNFPHKPSGKAIDLEKYIITKDKSYFDIVTE